MAQIIDDIDETGARIPRSSTVTLTHVMYALHSISALAGVLTPAFVVTSFLAGWPSIIAVILNLIKRSEVRGTWLESHLSWQLRTFFYALLWVLVAGLLIITLVGIVLAIPLAIVLGLWVVYRLARGWLALFDRKPLHTPIL